MHYCNKSVGRAWLSPQHHLLSPSIMMPLAPQIDQGATGDRPWCCALPRAATGRALTLPWWLWSSSTVWIKALVIFPKLQHLLQPLCGSIVVSLFSLFAQGVAGANPWTSCSKLCHTYHTLSSCSSAEITVEELLIPPPRRYTTSVVI